MLFLIYTCTILVILQCKGTTTIVPDPCPSTIVTSTVADMCRSSSATEETFFGNNKVDSVVLRIMTQQDNCTCRVTLDNQTQSVSIGLRKYDGLTLSAPEKNECGLVVDITHIPDMSMGIAKATIECVVNGDVRNLQLLQNSTLHFKSRIIDGNFIRGYCMRIQRDSSTNHSQALRIVCDAPTIKQHTTHQIITSDPTTDTSTTTFPQTTESVKSSTVIKTLTTDPLIDAPKKFENLSMTTDPTTGIEQTTYIAIGAGSGVALILLVVFVVVCLRRKSTHKAGTNGNVNKSYQEDESDNKLQDNVLYVPATQFDITCGNYSIADVVTSRSSSTRLSMEGNYSTVDEDTPKSSNSRTSMEDNYSTVELDEHLVTHCSYPENSELRQKKRKEKPTIMPKPKSSCVNSEENRSSDQTIKHISPPNGSDNVYAIVDKTSKNVPITDGSKGDGTCQPDQTYAVVDKARRRKSRSSKFEIHSGIR